jgi:hypothetical protein
MSADDGLAELAAIASRSVSMNGIITGATMN